MSLAPVERFGVERTGGGTRLCGIVLGLAECRGVLLSHSERAWASITFSGTRHRIVLQFDGAAAVAAGERFVAALPDYEFAIRGQLVADAAIRSVDHRVLPVERMIVEAELLLLEEG